MADKITLKLRKLWLKMHNQLQRQQNDDFGFYKFDFDGEEFHSEDILLIGGHLEDVNPRWSP